MKRCGRLVFAAGLLFASAVVVRAYEPMLISFVVDASASVSRADFRVANEALVAYVNQIRARSLVQSDQPSSIALVDYFGGPEVELDAFRGVADAVTRVDGFRELELALVALPGVLD